MHDLTMTLHIDDGVEDDCKYWGDRRVRSSSRAVDSVQGKTQPFLHGERDCGGREKEGGSTYRDGMNSVQAVAEFTDSKYAGGDIPCPYRRGHGISPLPEAVGDRKTIRVLQPRAKARRDGIEFRRRATSNRRTL